MAEDITPRQERVRSILRRAIQRYKALYGDEAGLDYISEIVLDKIKQDQKLVFTEALRHLNPEDTVLMLEELHGFKKTK